MNKFILLVLIISTNSIFALSAGDFARSSVVSVGSSYAPDTNVNNDLRSSNGIAYHSNMEKTEKAILDNMNSENIHQKFGPHKMTYFLCAASIGSIEGLKKSIELGANIFDLNIYDSNALHVLTVGKYELERQDIDSGTRQFYNERYYKTYAYLKYIFYLYNNIKQSLNKKIDSNEKLDTYNNYDENIFKIIFQYLINDIKVCKIDLYDFSALIANNEETTWINLKDINDSHPYLSAYKTEDDEKPKMIPPLCCIL